MKRVITLALAGLLTACSSQMQMPSIDDILPSKELDRTMYLRGDFTLWDAEPQYKLEQVAPGIFQTEVKFSTPGKVYEFKVVMIILVTMKIMISLATMRTEMSLSTLITLV